jgi:hypothetical protein
VEAGEAQACAGEAGVITWFLAALMASPPAGAYHPTEWAADDPQRPLMVAIAASDAPLVQTAARNCGLTNQRRLSWGDLEWIVMQDVLASQAASDDRANCLLAWARAHPQIRVMFFGPITVMGL